MQEMGYPVQFSVDYPDRPLNRLTTFFRIFTVIAIAIVLGALSTRLTWPPGDTQAPPPLDAAPPPRHRSGAGPGSSAEAAWGGCAHRDVAPRRTAMDRGPTVT